MTSVITAISTNKFNSLTLVDNGLILKKGKNDEKKILFSELDKIYIKSCKLNPVVELLFIFSPFVLIFLSVQYFSFNLIIVASIFTIFPVFIAVHNCKWYCLIVCQKDGESFRKMVPQHLKTEIISIMEKVQNEFLSYKCSLLVSA